MSGQPSIVLFRDDLRLADNPALRAALERDEKVVCLFVLDEDSAGIRPLGGAARWWLHGSLRDLAEHVADAGATLVMRRGRTVEVVREVVSDIGAGAVFWNRRYGGAERRADAELKKTLREDGVQAESFAAALLFEPWEIQTGQGTPYAVFTPFWRACRAAPNPRRPLPKPRALPGLRAAVPSEDPTAWGLLPEPDWAGGLRETWQPGESHAHTQLHRFAAEDLAGYERGRDEPAADTTSRLSPRLRWGELSPHQVWHAVEDGDGPSGAKETFRTELGWREFAWHTLYAFPQLAHRNWRDEFDRFGWGHPDRAHLEAWRHGRTGIPLVDAGMRELWHTGYMHNRVRMVTASFLVKNLLVDWRVGEKWFWDTLVDADAASNPFNWQWVAGSGADGAPYFRIFNPERQRERFDPDGRYIAQWAGPDAPDEPIVDLAATRRRALDAYETMRRSS